jgi:hypothetical protein
MPRKECRYTGELAKPILLPAMPEFWGAWTEERLRKRRRAFAKHCRDAERFVEEEFCKKMELLLMCYGVTDLAQLAWELAVRHVPGFEVVLERPERRGRKKEWDGEKLQALFDAVQEVKTRYGITDRGALNFIANNSEFKGRWGPPADYRGTRNQWIETLESRLQAAKQYIRRLESLPKLLETAKFRKS